MPPNCHLDMLWRRFGLSSLARQFFFDGHFLLRRWRHSWQLVLVLANISREIYSQRNYFVYFYRWSKETKFPAHPNLSFNKKARNVNELDSAVSVFRLSRREMYKQCLWEFIKRWVVETEKSLSSNPLITNHRVHESPPIRSVIQKRLKFLDELASSDAAAAATPAAGQQPVPECLRLLVDVLRQLVLAARVLQPAADADHQQPGHGVPQLQRFLSQHQREPLKP